MHQLELLSTEIPDRSCRETEKWGGSLPRSRVVLREVRGRLLFPREYAYYYSIVIFVWFGCFCLGGVGCWVCFLPFSCFKWKNLFSMLKLMLFIWLREIQIPNLLWLWIEMYMYTYHFLCDMSSYVPFAYGCTRLWITKKKVFISGILGHGLPTIFAVFLTYHSSRI
jgi:hypothetical protein